MSVSTEKEVNYTPEMIAAIEAACPLNLEKAKAVAEEIGKTYRSVIAKAKSLGFEYVSKPAPAKKAKAMTKVEKVAIISFRMNCKLEGLEKAPVSALDNINAYLDSQIVVEPVAEES